MRLNFAFIALFLGLHGSLWGGEFILSSSFFNALKTEKSKAIFKDYERFMNEVSAKSLQVKLESVNFYINSFVGAYDEQSYQAEDYWASRGEFLKTGGGDCEDYVFSKLYTLKDLGVHPEKMAACIVQEKYSNQKHMVLLVWKDAYKEALVLDNLSFKILELSKRVDLHVKQCMNENGYFKLTEQGAPSTIKSPIKIKTYEAMLSRNKHEVIWAVKPK